MQQEMNLDPRVTGQQGGLKRAARLSAEKRHIIASIAAWTRWHPEKVQAEREKAERTKHMVERERVPEGPMKRTVQHRTARPPAD